MMRVLLVLSLCLGCFVVSADGLTIGDIKIDKRVSAVRALGRIFVSEGGWNSIADEFLILRVLQRRLVRSSKRVRRMPLRRSLTWIAKRYSTRTFQPDEVQTIPKSPHRSARQRWVNELSSRCLRPPSWPSSYPAWGEYRGRCRALFRRARLMVLGRTKDLCTASAPVDHWGSEEDTWRPKKGNWVKVNFACPGSDDQTHRPKNLVWCDPKISTCVSRNVGAYALVLK